ncbi:MAG TPA: EamA family transporter [Solirubrobacteraceae bacterium]|jgi:drug/metabolite transporter (DMT)-like permease
MIAILGGLGAAVAWAISTLCSSRSSRILDPIVVVGWVMLVGLVVALPPALAVGVPSRLWGGDGAWLLLAGATNVGGLIVTYEALKVGQVALVAPIVSSEGALAAVIAVLAGETIAAGSGVALAVIAVGIWLASTPAPAEAPALAEAPARAAQPARPRAEGLALAVCAAAIFGASLYATGRASADLPSAWIALAPRLVGLPVIVLPLAALGRLRLVRPAAPLVVASGICEVVGFYSYAGGSRHGIAIAAVLSSQFGAIAAVAGYALFGERLTRMQVAGVVTLLVGVAALSALSA